MASNNLTCAVCGKSFTSSNPATRTCSPECFMVVEADTASEGAGMVVPNAPCANIGIGNGPWASPLSTTGFQPVFDPTTQQKGDKTKFVSQVLECPVCGAVLKNSNRQCPDCDFTRTPKARRVKLQVIRTPKEVCDECQAPLVRLTNSFGQLADRVCSVCGLVH